MQSALRSLHSLLRTHMLDSWLNFTSHLSWTQQRVNEMQKRCYMVLPTPLQEEQNKKREGRGIGSVHGWFREGSSELVWDQADGSTGCLQAGTVARWRWSSPPRRTGCTRKWVARQGLSSSTDASSHAATQDSLEDMASCIPSLPAPEPLGSPCLQKDMYRSDQLICRPICVQPIYSQLENYWHPWWGVVKNIRIKGKIKQKKNNIIQIHTKSYKKLKHDPIRFTWVFK